MEMAVNGGVGKKKNPLIRWIRRLYDWVLSLAETRHAGTALFCIAFAESSFFPIPPDVLLIAMGVAAPRKALRFASICLLGSVLGGAFGYALGWGAWSALAPLFFTYVPGFTPQAFEHARQIFNDNALITIFTAGFTPIPYKIFTLSAGVAKTPFGLFILVSILSRGLRFFLVGGALKFFGASVKVWIDRYFDLLTVVFTILFVGGIVLIKYIH